MSKKTIYLISFVLMWVCLVGSMTSFAQIVVVYENDYEGETVGADFPAWNWADGACTHTAVFADYNDNIVVEHTGTIDNTGDTAVDTRFGSKWDITVSGNTSSEPNDYTIEFDLRSVSGDWDPISLEFYVLTKEDSDQGYGSGASAYAQADGWVHVKMNLADLSVGWWQGTDWDLTNPAWSIEVGGPPWPGTPVNPGESWTQIWLMDNLKITLLRGNAASNPYPKNDATDVESQPTLSWTPGVKAASHKVYLDPDEQNVTARSGCEVNGVSTTEPNYLTDSLDLGETYYWAIDEVNGATVWPGPVWRFTVGHYFILDNFERYDNSDDMNEVWSVTGSNISLNNTVVNSGESAMQYDYTNDTLPYYTEAYADTNGPNSLDFGTNWAIKGAVGLGLWFLGYPDARGSFTGTDPYTIVADGRDIWETSDSFHYAYRQVSSSSATWQITVKVDSVENVHAWSKAGVMVRRTLTPGSEHIAVSVTPGNGVELAWRETPGGDTSQVNDANNLAAPKWLRLKRISATKMVIAYHANDVGGPWKSLGAYEDTDGLFTCTPTTPMYVGMHVTSHSYGEMCTAEFSNLTMEVPTDTVIADPNTSEDIGIPYNAPEPMYVMLEDSDSNGIVYYDNKDPNATQEPDWTHWAIMLSEFEAQGVDMTDVQKMYIGIGDKGAPSAGGAGTIHIDDIRLYEPYCVLSERSDALTQVDFAPAGFPESGDCVVDEQELGIMASDWLMTEDAIIPTDSNNITNGLVAHYHLDEGDGTTTTDASGNGHTGTFSTSGITWVPGLLGNSAINADGEPGGRISVGTFDPAAGNNQLTLALWIRWGGLSGNSRGLIGKRDGWDSNDVLRFMFEISSFNDYQLAFRQYEGPDVAAAGVMLPYIGKWAHVAVTFDGTISDPNDPNAPNTWIYLNGEEVASGPFTLGTATGATMTIGNTMSETAWPDSPETFNGDMDEVRIYDRTLTQAEIAYLADLTTPGDGKLHVPLASNAELYGLEAEPARAIDLRDFAVMAKTWLEEELWP
jgi:hypothetical protein